MSDDAPAPRSRVPLIALITGVGLIVVIAVIAILVRGEPAELDPATPEGVVQRYSQAVADGDTATALTYLVPEVAGSCEHVSVESEEHRLTLQEAEEQGDSARVTVIIVTTYGSGPLGSNEYESEEVFELVKADDGWLIEWVPWPLAICANGAR